MTMDARPDDYPSDQPTPYFVLDRGELTERLNEFRTQFQTDQIYYAMKANPHPEVLRTLAAHGCGFESASWPEIEILLGIGVPPQRIIYGTAVKPRDHVLAAAGGGVDRFAADS